MKVLLVDDEESLLQIFSQTLQTGGFEVTTASNGNDAIQKIKTVLPDVVLLDQVLPDINGNQVLQTMKADPATQNIPVAILSNFSQGDLMKDAINMGAVDYILKYQVEPKDLIEKVKQIAAEHPANGNPTTVVVSTTEKPATPPMQSTPIQSGPTPMPASPTPPMPQPTLSTGSPLSSTMTGSAGQVGSMTTPMASTPMQNTTPPPMTAPIQPATPSAPSSSGLNGMQSGSASPAMPTDTMQPKQ